ncbi:MAG: PepSY-like domain-containing protein [Chitinophagaceae bacterium]
MKLNSFLIISIIFAVASCKPAYKATDRSGSTMDSTASTADTTTSSSMDRTSDTTSSVERNTSDTMAINNNAPMVNVPAGTQTAFTTQYPNATNIAWGNYDSLAAMPIDWEMTGWTPLDANDHIVQFNVDNENYYAWYDSDGNWVGSTYKLKDHTKLPLAVHAAIKTKYADYTITEIETEMAKGKTAYEVELEKDVNKVKLLIDAEGNILKEKSKTK